jgi:hypothetical protein
MFVISTIWNRINHFNLRCFSSRTYNFDVQEWFYIIIFFDFFGQIQLVNTFLLTFCFLSWLWPNRVRTFILGNALSRWHTWRPKKFKPKNLKPLLYTKSETMWSLICKIQNLKLHNKRGFVHQLVERPGLYSPFWMKKKWKDKKTMRAAVRQITGGWSGADAYKQVMNYTCKAYRVLYSRTM